MVTSALLGGFLERHTMSIYQKKINIDSNTKKPSTVPKFTMSEFDLQIHCSNSNHVSSSLEIIKPILQLM